MHQFKINLNQTLSTYKVHSTPVGFDLEGCGFNQKLTFVTLLLTYGKQIIISITTFN
jgi:hypothetical protein